MLSRSAFYHKVVYCSLLSKTVVLSEIRNIKPKCDCDLKNAWSLRMLFEMKNFETLQQDNSDSLATIFRITPECFIFPNSYMFITLNKYLG